MNSQLFFRRGGEKEVGFWERGASGQLRRIYGTKGMDVDMGKE